MPELREPRPLPPPPPGSRYFCEHIQACGCTEEGLGGSPTEPWASRRRNSLGLCACLWPWLKFLTQELFVSYLYSYIKRNQELKITIICLFQKLQEY